jgi:hypothetical protein
MPWSAKPRKNYFNYASEDQLEIVLAVVKTKLIEWSGTRAGQISGTSQIQEKPE